MFDGYENNVFELYIFVAEKNIRNAPKAKIIASPAPTRPNKRLLEYTGYAGWAVSAAIPVKFGTAHDAPRPEVGSTKCIGAYGRKWVTPTPRFFCTSNQIIIPPTIFLRSIHDFFSLTVCNLDQYLPNGSKKSGFLS